MCRPMVGREAVEEVVDCVGRVWRVSVWRTHTLGLTLMVCGSGDGGW